MVWKNNEEKFQLVRLDVGLTKLSWQKKTPCGYQKKNNLMNRIYLLFFINKATFTSYCYASFKWW